MPSDTKGKRKKRRMLSFKMDELSGVDRPAQQPALAVIMKRDGLPKAEDVDVEKTITFEGEHALTTSEDGHSHLIPLGAGRAGMTSHSVSEGAEFGHSHPFVINAEGRVTIGEAEGHTHRVARTTKADGSTTDGGDAMSGTATKAAGKDQSADDLKKELTKAQEEVQTLQLVVKLSPEHRAHYDTLKGEDALEFLTSSEADRDSVVKAELAKAADANPVVYTATDGTEFRKNDDTRLVEMAKQADADRKELAKERRARLDAQLAKRADDELGSLPGETTTKVEVLRAIDGISDEATRKAAHELLKAGNDALAKGFDRFGTALTKDVEGGDPNAELEALAQKYATDHKVDIVKARVAVLETPEGEALYAKSVA